MNPSLDHGKVDDDEIVLPSFDPAKAMRGVFAHRRGEQPEDERRVAEFWESRGFAVEPLEQSRDLFSRLPDLRLLRDGQLFAYCEVKTVWRHTREIRILHEDRPVEERLELSTVPAEERFSTDLVTAIRQLNYTNSDHTLMNFVVLVNRDPEATPALLAKLFAKRPPSSKRGLQDKQESWTVEAIQDFRCKVDLCLWIDGLAGFSVTGYFVGNPSLREQAAGIAGLDLDKLLLLEPAA